MNATKIRKKNKQRFKLLLEKITKYSDKIEIPKNITAYDFFNIGDINNNIFYSDKTLINDKSVLKLQSDKLLNEPVKTYIHRLYPNANQKKILNTWFDSYIDMYNLVINKFRNEFKAGLLNNPKFKLTDLNTELNISKLKIFFKADKEKISNLSKINKHILDYAIQDACSAFKSKVSNLTKSHQSKSRLRYLKKTKPTKIIKIEKQICSTNSFCSNILGKSLKISPNINYNDDITITAIVKYDSKTKKYYLYRREYIRDNIEEDFSIIKSFEKLINMKTDIKKTYNDIRKLSYLNPTKDSISNINNTIIEKINNYNSLLSTINFNGSNNDLHNFIVRQTNEAYHRQTVRLFFNYDLLFKDNGFIQINQQKLFDTNIFNKLLMVRLIFNYMYNIIRLIVQDIGYDKLEPYMSKKLKEDKTKTKKDKIKKVISDSNDNRCVGRLITRMYKKYTTNNENFLSVDPGIRTFMTGLSNDHMIEYGSNLSTMIEKKLIGIDKVENNKDINPNRKNKIKNRLYNNLKNKVKDYHWKIIKDMTDNYNHILMGNFSTKKMAENDSTNKLIKRIGQMMGFYSFKQRLQYKCYLKGLKYKHVDEYCTTKCCSLCGYFKKDLGCAKTYVCNNKQCKNIIDRDINASKNILLRSIE